MSQFSLSLYRKYNPDLCDLSDEQLIKHYQIFGLKENRIASQEDVDRLLLNFDPDGYRDNNPDLAHMTNDELKNHWLTYGYREGRKYRVEKDYSLTPQQLEYIRYVDFKQVVKCIDTVCERLCDYKTKLPISGAADLSQEKIATFIIQVIEKSGKGFNKETKRYLFGHSFCFLIDYLYQTGVIYHLDYLKWREVANNSIGLYDELTK
jgi:hypothetical protein